MADDSVTLAGAAAASARGAGTVEAESCSSCYSAQTATAGSTTVRSEGQMGILMQLETSHTAAVMHRHITSCTQPQVETPSTTAAVRQMNTANATVASPSIPAPEDAVSAQDTAISASEVTGPVPEDRAGLPQQDATAGHPEQDAARVPGCLQLIMCASLQLAPGSSEEPISAADYYNHFVQKLALSLPFPPQLSVIQDLRAKASQPATARSSSTKSTFLEPQCTVELHPVCLEAGREVGQDVEVRLRAQAGATLPATEVVLVFSRNRQQEYLRHPLSDTALDTLRLQIPGPLDVGLVAFTVLDVHGTILGSVATIALPAAAAAELQRKQHLCALHQPMLTSLYDITADFAVTCCLLQGCCPGVGVNQGGAEVVLRELLCSLLKCFAASNLLCCQQVLLQLQRERQQQQQPLPQPILQVPCSQQQQQQQQKPPQPLLQVPCSQQQQQQQQQQQEEHKQATWKAGVWGTPQPQHCTSTAGSFCSSEQHTVSTRGLLQSVLWGFPDSAEEERYRCFKEGSTTLAWDWAGVLWYLAAALSPTGPQVCKGAAFLKASAWALAAMCVVLVSPFRRKLGACRECVIWGVRGAVFLLLAVLSWNGVLRNHPDMERQVVQHKADVLYEAVFVPMLHQTRVTWSACAATCIHSLFLAIFSLSNGATATAVVRKFGTWCMAMLTMALIDLSSRRKFLENEAEHAQWRGHRHAITSGKQAGFQQLKP